MEKPANHHPSEAEVLRITGASGDRLVTVHGDGRITYGAGYTPDEAARVFWEALAHPSEDLVARARAAWFFPFAAT